MSLTINQRQIEVRYYEEPLTPDGSIPLRMMRIPSGTFLMGSPEAEEGRRKSESPQHEVKLSQFFMAKYPVTQHQWRAVAAMQQVNQKLKSNPSHFKGDKRPVENVSWHDAVEFCDRLTVHTNRQYRLPTEAEWEYACRGETMTPFHFGPTLSTDYANYNGSYKEYGAYGPGTHGEYRAETTPVDHFPGTNAYGLHDMHGNVLEWCQDHWHGNYDGAPDDGSAWIEDGDSDLRVLRGGSWLVNPRLCRSAYRYSDTPVYRLLNIGFRVVCSAPRALP